MEIHGIIGPGCGAQSTVQSTVQTTVQTTVHYCTVPYKLQPYHLPEMVHKLHKCMDTLT